MPSIRDILAAKQTFSFELMPPRSAETQAHLEVALAELQVVDPDFVSITYGAGGTTRQRTHDLVIRLLATSLTPMAHLTCAAHSRSELVQILTRYRVSGLQNVLALRGDPPLASEGGLPEGELGRATELVELTRSVGDFTVSVAAHPEGHPDSPDRETDLKYQAAKISKADFAITQFFFKAADYFRFVNEMADRGVDKPIVPGIMPPSNVAQLEKMAAMSGARIPSEVDEKLRRFGDDAASVRRAGIEIATRLAAKLLSDGAPGVHIYTMNRSAATISIHSDLGLGSNPS